MNSRIPVKKLTVNFGLNAQGQIMGNSHVETERKKLWVVPGRYAIIETADLQGNITTVEMPIGPFGFEYVQTNKLN